MKDGGVCSCVCVEGRVGENGCGGSPDAGSLEFKEGPPHGSRC